MDILIGLFKEGGWFLFGLFLIAVVWFLNGGTENPEAHEGPYLKPPAPLSTGEAYGGAYLSEDRSKQSLDLPQAPAVAWRNVQESIADFASLSQEADKVHTKSLLSKSIYLDSVAGAQSSDPQKEYLRILSDDASDKTVDISALSLRGSAYGVTAQIPQAAEKPVLASAYEKSDVMVPPGGRVLISSGRSPIGTSFRVNACTGYLNQFQTFTPDLRQECPDPIEELKKTSAYDDYSCRAFVEGLPRCRAYGGALPPTMSAACKGFIAQKLNYNSCVAAHSSEKDFYRDEWRLFLEQTTELWKNKQEIIRLMDPNGATIDAITY